MTTPSPITLAIAVTLEAALTPLISAVIAPLAERLQKLEDSSRNQFDEDVMTSIRNQTASVVDLLEDEIKERVKPAYEESIGDRVERILENGHFSVDFSRG